MNFAFCSSSLVTQQNLCRLYLHFRFLQCLCHCQDPQLYAITSLNYHKMPNKFCSHLFLVYFHLLICQEFLKMLKNSLKFKLCYLVYLVFLVVFGFLPSFSSFLPKVEPWLPHCSNLFNLKWFMFLSCAYHRHICFECYLFFY